MVERCASGVEEDDYTAETGPDEGCDDDRLPGKANGVQARTNVVCGRREGYTELKGKEVPCGPIPFSWWSGLEVNVAPAAM